MFSIVEVECQKCGKIFKVYPNRLNHGRGKFCSKSCSISFNHLGKAKPKSREHALKLCENNKGKRPWNYNRIEVACEFCERKVMITRARLNTFRFCSNECHFAWKKTIAGINHPLWTRVIRICQWCGKEFSAKPAKISCGEGKFCSRSCLASHNVKYAMNGKRSSIEFKMEKILIEMGLEFEIQKQIDIFLVDFYLPKYKLVIECDGIYWHSRPEVKRRDFLKDRWLRQEGYKCLRITDKVINESEDNQIVVLIKAQI